MAMHDHEHDRDERLTEGLIPTSGAAGADEEYRKEQAEIARIQRGNEYRETFTTDFDRDVFLHGSMTEQDYPVPDGPVAVELEADAIPAVRGLVGYAGKDTPSYGAPTTAKSEKLEVRSP
jgi:hypothetical protein